MCIYFDRVSCENWAMASFVLESKSAYTWNRMEQNFTVCVDNVYYIVKLLCN